MKVDLLPHNQEAYEKIKSEIAEGKKKIAIAHATGTGKSYLIAKLFEDYSEKRKLVLVPSTYISDQIQELFEKYDIANADIMLYQKLIKMSDEDIAAMDYDVIALDEYHHDTSKVWGVKVRTLNDTHPESIIFGTSATPVRSDGVNTIDELFEGNCASNLPLSESIAKKIVPLPKYVGALYALDDELERLRKKVENATNTKEEKQELYKKINTMRKQIEKSYGMPIILNKNIKDREGKYIVFCKNKKHLADIKETVIEWFKTAGFKDIHAYVVHSDYENKDAEYKAFCDDTSHNSKLLFCIDMLNEGLHLENISGVLLLRPTRSMLIFLQQIGRAIEANNTNTPVIIDAVNNFSSVGQGMELLKEIKDAIAKEKESNPNFDDSGFEDIDTFFVLEQVIEIQEMFRAIEERLEGNWEEGLRHFDKYVREHNGDVLVPLRYKDDDGFPIGNWVSHRRRELNILSEYKIAELNKRGFVWNSVLYNFENSVKAFSEYYNKYKKYPSYRSKDPNEKRLGRLLYKEKMQMRNNNITYPRWKEEIINKYLPEFSCEYEKDRLFNEFLYYVKLYKEKYGHVNIKTDDVIAGYNIGRKRSTLSRHNCYNSLSKHQLNKLKDLGVYLGNKNDKQFDGTMELARQAVKEGVVINKTNSKYKDRNLYSWVHSVVKRRYENNNLSLGEIKIVEKLVGRLLNDIFNKKQGRVKIMDITENIEVGLFKSKCEAARVMREKYNVRINDSIIRNHLTGKITTPYKGRFMFYYADENKKVTE